MPPKIVIEPMERSLPTSVRYRSDRIFSFRIEDDVPTGKSMRPGTTDEEWQDEQLRRMVAHWRREQLADLDAQEGVLSARWDMEAPDKPGQRAARIAKARADQGMPPDDGHLPGFTTADKVHPFSREQPTPHGLERLGPAAASMQVPPIADAPRAAGTVMAREVPATRTTPPPSALRSVADGTIDELRALGLRLTDLGAPYEGPMPSSEAEAQALLPQLRARVFDLNKAAAPPAQALTVSKAPGYVKPDGSPFTPGHQVKAFERKCGRDSSAISGMEWNDSMRSLGSPLCALHLKETLNKRAK